MALCWRRCRHAMRTLYRLAVSPCIDHSITYDIGELGKQMRQKNCQSLAKCVRNCVRSRWNGPPRAHCRNIITNWSVKFWRIRLNIQRRVDHWKLFKLHHAFTRLLITLTFCVKVSVQAVSAAHLTSSSSSSSETPFCYDLWYLWYNSFAIQLTDENAWVIVDLGQLDGRGRTDSWSLHIVAQKITTTGTTNLLVIVAILGGLSSLSSSSRSQLGLSCHSTTTPQSGLSPEVGRDRSSPVSWRSWSVQLARGRPGWRLQSWPSEQPDVRSTCPSELTDALCSAYK